jgi:hypothetical protein
MVVLMLVIGAEVLEPAGHVSMIVGDVIVPVGVHHRLVFVLVPPVAGVRHAAFLSFGASDLPPPAEFDVPREPRG